MIDVGLAPRVLPDSSVVVPNSLDSWDVVETNFPRVATTSAQLHFLLHYAVLAPSTHNVQPWRFRVLPEHVEFYVDTTRSLPVADPDCRELVISCGAALYYFRLALRHFHFAGEITYFPVPADPYLLARVGLGATVTPTADEEAAFKAIPHRHTHRLPFHADAVSQAVVAALQTAAEADGTWLRTIDQRDARSAVAHLIAEADVLLMNDKRYRSELARWLRANRSAERDGIPGYALGLSDFQSSLAPLTMRLRDSGDQLASHERELASQAPVLAVLGTATDTSADWLNAGQAMAHVLLLGRSQGVHAAFLNAPVQFAALRQRLMAILHRNGVPQLILRMGHAADARPTPRRPLSDVLLP